MPWAPLRVCPRHRLRLPPNKRCPRCWREYDAKRPEHHAFYNSSDWRLLRLEVLAAAPLCMRGCGRRSVDVDHVIPRKQRPDLALARENLEALCHACHMSKSRREGT